MTEEFELNALQNGANELAATTSSGISSSSNTKAEYLIQQLNATNFKKLALAVVIGFIVYHGILNWQYGMEMDKWNLCEMF